MLGVQSQDVNAAVETYFGSSYINDFNMFGRTYHVTAQADSRSANSADDLTRIKVRNAAGDMVPLGNVATLVDTFGADRVPRYNLFPATEINGDTSPGVGAAYGRGQDGGACQKDPAAWHQLRVDRSDAISGPRPATWVC